MATTERAKAPAAATGGQAGQGPQIRWDDAKMESAYANVCNVSSTREEVVLVFGVNQAWQREQAEVTIQLTNRIILSPFAAKRLAVVLNNIMRDHESRFGTLNIDLPRQTESPENK